MARIDIWGTNEQRSQGNYKGSRLRCLVIDRAQRDFRDAFVGSPHQGKVLNRGEILEACTKGKSVFVLDFGSKGQDTDRPTEYTWWRVNAAPR